MKAKKKSSRPTSWTGEPTGAIVKKSGKFKNRKGLVAILAIVVLVTSGYSMILPATTMSQQSYCGQDEHTHTDECYDETLACQLEEHTHQQACFSNPEADVESQEVWERSVGDVNLTGVWADDLVNVAESQLGYNESDNNYIVDEDGNIKGYTRYGAWYGEPYGDWSSMFVSFCMNFAEITEEEIPRESDTVNWAKSLSEMGLYEPAGDFIPQKGDLVFLSSAEETGEPDRVGIVSEVVLDNDGNVTKLLIVQGDAEKQVLKTTYEAENSHIVGYGMLPQNPDGVMPEEAAESGPVKAKASALAERRGTTGSNIYIGYSKLQPDIKTFEFAKLEGGVGVRKFYLASEAIYDQYTNLPYPTYADQDRLIANSQLAYCFNYYKEPPTNTYNQSSLSEYYENESASAYLFYNATSNHVRIKNANQLYEKVLSVALNGYPNDYLGIQAKYRLTDDVFRAITQYAVWYYTDSISIRIYDYTNYYMYADDTNTWLTKKDGAIIAIPFTNSNWLNAYYELINSSVDSGYINNHHINLFKNTTGAYQHLLTVGLEEAPPSSLELMKTVTGKAGNQNKEFNFKIVLADQSKTLLRYTTFNVTPAAIDGVEVPTINEITTNGYGEANVKLKHGQSITINDLPNRFFYEITENEANQDGYETTVDGAESNMTTSIGVTGDVEVEFINDKTPSQPAAQGSSLKLGKTVTGTAGETDKEFEFGITVKNRYGTSISGTYDVIPEAINGVTPPNITQITLSGGVAFVNLKHGQSITILGLPDEFYYSIYESNADGHIVSVSEEGDPATNNGGQGITGTANVQFINHKDAPPPPPSYDTEIKVSKTLDGGLPGDGQFTFILRDADGNEIARDTNDANGEVTFPLTITEPGTYTYTVEELNDQQEGIVYDTAVKTVTVTVTSETVEEILNGDSFVGSGTQGNYKITVNGTKVLDVYCIDGSAGNPYGNYEKFLNPTTGQLEGQVTANYYGTALSDNMRKLLYYFDTHEYTDTVSGGGFKITLSKDGRQELIWCLTGNPGQQHISYRGPLNTILAESNPPSGYAVVMFASTNTPKAQPVIAGYLPGMNVVYEGEAGSVEFANYYEYLLPETGGRGKTGYTLGGMLLLCSAVVLMCRYKLERRKGGSC